MGVYSLTVVANHEVLRCRPVPCCRSFCWCAAGCQLCCQPVHLPLQLRLHCCRVRLPCLRCWCLSWLYCQPPCRLCCPARRRCCCPCCWSVRRSVWRFRSLLSAVPRCCALCP